MDEIVQRPCTILESLEQACKEMVLIREGKLPKRDWRDMFAEIEEEIRCEEEALLVAKNDDGNL